MPSAGAWDDASIEMRAQQWSQHSLVGSSSVAPAVSKLRAAMAREGCTALAGFRFPLDEWKHIERIALRLKITVGDYLLGHVGYAMWADRQEPAPTPKGIKFVAE